MNKNEKRIILTSLYRGNVRVPVYVWNDEKQMLTATYPVDKQEVIAVRKGFTTHLIYTS